MNKQSSAHKILIAGIGNIFLGDDAFGSEVARKLAERPWPDSVRVVDFGIRGLDLVYALLDGYRLAILVDATPQGGRPGTLYKIKPELSDPRESDNSASPLIDAHTMNPLNVLRTVHAMGGTRPNVLLVGCEPADLGGDDGKMGLSCEVQNAIEPACEMVASIVSECTSAYAETGRIANPSYRPATA